MQLLSCAQTRKPHVDVRSFVEACRSLDCHPAVREVEGTLSPSILLSPSCFYIRARSPSLCSGVVTTYHHMHKRIAPIPERGERIASTA